MKAIDLIEILDRLGVETVTDVEQIGAWIQKIAVVMRSATGSRAAPSRDATSRSGPRRRKTRPRISAAPAPPPQVTAPQPAARSSPVQPPPEPEIERPIVPLPSSLPTPFPKPRRTRRPVTRPPGVAGHRSGGPIKRCPDCGAMVEMPCRACAMNEALATQRDRTA